MDTGTKIFMFVICLILIILLWVMIVWPVALVGTILVIICIWGTIFGGFTSYLCEQMPNDPYCVEQVE